MLRLSRVLLPAVAAVAFAGATAGAQQGRYFDDRRSIDTTYAFSRDGLVDASQIAGDITVTTWDRADVRVRAYAERGRVVADLSRNQVRLRVESSGGRNGIGDSRFEVTVPRGTRVLAASVSGDVRVSGTQAEVEARSTSGDVTVSESAGLTSVTSVSGDVTVGEVNGDLTVKSVSGDLDVRGVRGDVRANTVSGEVMLQGLRSRNVTAKTTSGEIAFDGELARDGRYEFTSHSGDVTLVMADATGIDLSLRTFSGELESDFPVTLGGRGTSVSSRSMDFSLSGGGARVSVETFSGDVLLRRAGGRSRR